MCDHIRRRRGWWWCGCWVKGPLTQRQEFATVFLTFVNVKYVTPHIETQCCNIENGKFQQRKCKCLQIILSD